MACSSKCARRASFIWELRPSMSKPILAAVTPLRAATRGALTARCAVRSCIPRPLAAGTPLKPPAWKAAALATSERNARLFLCTTDARLVSETNLKEFSVCCSCQHAQKTRVRSTHDAGLHDVQMASPRCASQRHVLHAHCWLQRVLAAISAQRRCTQWVCHTRGNGNTTMQPTNAQRACRAYALHATESSGSSRTESGSMHF